MTPLSSLLARRIRADGPITVASFMGECLLHPQYGYYTRRAPFGAEGDFITAPEISQMFGEMLGLCLAQYWLDTGCPAPFTLAELGPGRGTLMADVLRATQGIAGFHDAARIVMLEASPRLRDKQADALSGFALPHPPVWIDTVDALPEGPLFLLANEFFDALPIRQFVRDGKGWSERLVGLKGDALAFGLSDAMPRPDLDSRFPDDPPGTLVEICPPALLHAEQIADRIHRHGGLALIVDYGGWRSKGDTLQALRGHAYADPLAEPGLADLTSHVDFQALAAAAAPLAYHYTEQRPFLLALGIALRAEKLASRLDGTARENHLAAYRRLTDPAEMGSLFKVLGLRRPGDPPPPGFTHDT